MPTEVSVAMLRTRESATHTKGDIHETDTEYLRKCHEVACKAAQLCGWKTISCVTNDSTLHSIEEIHEEIWAIVSNTLAD